MEHVEPPTADLQGPTLVAESPAMKEVVALATRAAASDATILIQGETGTGKEVIARLIHRCSPRRGGPFVPVNCGASTDSLLASELFGHVRGAFTGAVSDRAGVFEVAAGGTVFLDEIGATSPAMQVKLLRVLQERRVTRVGSWEELPVDIRVVAATNAELSDLVRLKQFREDLYYRIKVVSCRLPPLRDRPEDIPPLIEAYLAYFCERQRKPPIGLAGRTRELLLAHAWPGNVRQLCSELEKIVAMSSGTTPVSPSALSEDVRVVSTSPTVPSPDASRRPTPQTTPPAPSAREPTYQELLDSWTSPLIADRLSRYDGSITKTAQSLGISRSTLYALVKKYGLQGKDE